MNERLAGDYSSVARAAAMQHVSLCGAALPGDERDFARSRAAPDAAAFSLRNHGHRAWVAECGFAAVDGHHL
jgi:hypothetical protein